MPDTEEKTVARWIGSILAGCIVAVAIADILYNTSWKSFSDGLGMLIGLATTIALAMIFKKYQGE